MIAPATQKSRSIDKTGSASYPKDRPACTSDSILLHKHTRMPWLDQQSDTKSSNLEQCTQTIYRIAHKSDGRYVDDRVPKPGLPRVSRPCRICNEYRMAALPTGEICNVLGPALHPYEKITYCIQTNNDGRFPFLTRCEEANSIQQESKTGANAAQHAASVSSQALPIIGRRVSGAACGYRHIQLFALSKFGLNLLLVVPKHSFRKTVNIGRATKIP